MRELEVAWRTREQYFIMEIMFCYVISWMSIFLIIFSFALYLAVGDLSRPFFYSFRRKYKICMRI